MVRCNSTFVVFMKTVPNFATMLEMNYRDMIATTRTVDIEKATGSDHITGASADSCYRYIRTLRMVQALKRILALVETMNVDNGETESLVVSHFDDLGLYSAQTERLLNLIEVATFFENPMKPAPFPAPILRNIPKMFLGNWKSLIYESCTKCSSAYIAFLSLVSCTPAASNIISQTLPVVFACLVLTKGTKMELCRLDFMLFIVKSAERCI